MSDRELSLRLAESAVARVCHDLSGALGAAMSALDYVTTGRTTPAFDALELAVEAVRELTARLRLARMLWTCEHRMALPELVQLCQGLPGRARLRLDVTMTGGNDTTLSAVGARLLLAVLCMAAESLHGHGVLSLGGEIGRTAVIAIEGVRASWPAELPTLLTRSPIAWSGSNAQNLMPQLTALLATQAGATLRMTDGAGPLTLEF